MLQLYKMSKAKVIAYKMNKAKVIEERKMWNSSAFVVQVKDTQIGLFYVQKVAEKLKEELI